MGLVSESHAWILPSYFDPNWWRLEDKLNRSTAAGLECSDDEMMAILESVIFIRSIKIPPTVRVINTATCHKFSHSV